MNDLKAIQNRISRRTYLGEPLDAYSELVMSDLIRLYNTTSGMTSFLLKDGSEAFESFLKSYGLFKNVKSLIVLKGPAGDPHLKEKTGYYGQKLILKATQLHLGTCWVGGTFDQENPIFNVSETESLYCVITIGKTPERETLKERLFSAAIHKNSKNIKQLFAADVEDNALPSYFVLGMNALLKAPTARNSQKVFVTLKENLVSISVPDDNKFDFVDLGIAKANFELAAGGRFEFGNNARFFLS